MTRFVNPFPQYIDISGAPNNGGFLKFFVSGTSTPKDVYSDSLFVTPLGNEVRLDAAGRVPTVFLDGAYRVVLTDPDGNEQDEADPIGVDTNVTAFDLWLVGTTYNQSDLVTGSDDLYYQSMVDSNLGNDPTSTSGFWERVLFHSFWEAVETYVQGELVIGSDGRTYQSQIGGNQGNDPVLGVGTEWEILLQSDSLATVSGIDINKTDAGQATFRWLNDDVQRWAWLFETDESLRLNRYDSGGVLQDAIFNVDTSGNIAITGLTSIFGQTAIQDGSFRVDRDGDATGASIEITSDAGERCEVVFQDATVQRWKMEQTAANDYAIHRYDNGGVLLGTPIQIEDGSDNILVQGKIDFNATQLGFLVSDAAGGSIDFDFPSTAAGPTVVDLFQNTNTSGNRFLNLYRGDGGNDVTVRLDASDGSIYPALDRAGVGDPGVKLGKITLSTNAPSGGQDGDLWLRY